MSRRGEQYGRMAKKNIKIEKMHVAESKKIEKILKIVENTKQKRKL